MKLTVNGEKIDPKDIEQEVERLRPQYEQYARDNNSEPNDEQLCDWSCENIVERVLLQQEAKRANKKPEDLIKEITDSIQPPSKKDVENFYELHKDSFLIPEQVRAAHIVKHVSHPSEQTQAYIEICNIQEKIKKGVAFDELAAENSDCPDNAGDLGYFTRGQMVQEFEDVAFKMNIGEVSDVLLTQFGYHIIKLTDRQKSAVAPLKEVENNIIQQIVAGKECSLIETFIDDLKAKAKITRK